MSIDEATDLAVTITNDWRAAGFAPPVLLGNMVEDAIRHIDILDSETHTQVGRVSCELDYRRLLGMWRQITAARPQTRISLN